MSLLGHVRAGLRVLRGRAAAEREIGDEIDHYIEESVAALVGQGVPAEEARRVVRRQLGDTAAIREDIRSYGWENLVEAFVVDLRQAARRLRRNPGSSVVNVLTLGLGIGATTAVLGAARPVLLDPVPYPEPERLAMVWDRSVDGGPVDVTFGTYRELRERTRAFEGLAVTRSWRPTMIGTGTPERLEGQRVSADYLRVLGIGPLLGRDFSAGDDRPGGPRVVILGHSLWRERFGADTAIIGRLTTLDDEPFEIAGVMPPDFEDVLAPSTRIWTVLQYDPALPVEGREWGHHLRMIGRLRAGLDEAAALRQLNAVAARPVPGFARPRWASLESGLTLQPLGEAVTGAARPVVFAILGSVFVLLVIACANVAGLLLIQGARRRGEFAMRAALGAGRSRLVRQLLIEGLVLAGIAALVGLLVAQLLIRWILVQAPIGPSRLGIDAWTFGLAAGIAALSGLTIGFVPALRAAGTRLANPLQHASRRVATARLGVRRGLVVLEAALALVLLVGAGLLLRSVERIFAIDSGFTAEGVIAMQIQTSGSGYARDEAVHDFFTAVLAQVERLPGVSSAALTSQLPLSGDRDVYGAHFEGGPTMGDLSALRYAISPGYLPTLGIALLDGRPLDDRDMAGAPLAVLINETFAHRRFPDGGAIGSRLRIGRTDGPWFTVVGIVADVKQSSLDAGTEDAVYVARPQWHFADPALWLVLRARGSRTATVQAVREAVWSVDPDRPIVRVAAMDELVAASEGRRRFTLVVFRWFALLALILSAVGLYGVQAATVTERRREIGVRCALGATPGHILRLVVGQGMTLLGAGVALGVLGALLTGQALGALLFRVSPLDPLTYAVSIALLGMAALAACLLPAWRATRVDPSTALSND